MEYLIINEANTDIKPAKKYKCPFCDYRGVRVDLVHHVNEEHEDMIPKGFTPARVVFNYVNKKESGRCIQCGKPTAWNEDRWKYERLCGDKHCHDEYVKLVKSRMVNCYGVEHRLNDPEIQKQMLANRKISGEYTFRDGGVRTYCGSYERKLLEFYDKVLNVPSKDIITPGPNIEYKYKGKNHIWITDIYYIPANLVHDVKDGGSNPNTRQMDDYRAKQDAKEAAIAKLGKYNYIRLTDNNFQQLLLILAELKEQLISDKNDDAIIRINEDVVAGALPNATDSDTYIIPYMMNNSFVGTAMSTSKYMDNLFIIQDGKKKKVSPTFLKEYNYTLLKYRGKADINSILEKAENVGNFYFYEALTGRDCIDNRQVFVDPDFEQVLDAYTEAILKISIRESSLMNAVNRRLLFTEVTNLSEVNTKEELIRKFPNLDILETVYGYIAVNVRTKESTNCNYRSLDEMPLDLLEVLNNG